MTVDCVQLGVSGFLQTTEAGSGIISMSLSYLELLCGGVQWVLHQVGVITAPL